MIYTLFQFSTYTIRSGLICEILNHLNLKDSIKLTFHREPDRILSRTITFHKPPEGQNKIGLVFRLLDFIYQM